MTYGQVRHVLIDVGFQEAPTRGSHLLLVQPGAQAFTCRRQLKLTFVARDVAWHQACVVENGIIYPAELDERVYAARA